MVLDVADAAVCKRQPVLLTTPTGPVQAPQRLRLSPYRLPNTGVLGSISCKFFARPDAATVDDKCLEPDVKVDLDDKDSSW